MTTAERPRRSQADSASGEGEKLWARRDQVEAVAEEFADIYLPGYLNDLRREWPE